MPLKIFYIDDEPGLLEIFADTFSSKGIEITTFEDHKLAIEEIKKNPPHIIFIDYRLKGTTGDKVIQEVDPSIPKAMITGELSMRLDPALFKSIFYKPFDFDAVEKFIQSHV